LYYIEYAYTPRNQLASIGNFANFTYDTSGNMTSRLQTWLYNNGTNFAYDDLSRVSQIELGDNSHIFSTRHYQYDTVSREKLTWRDEDNGFGTGRGERFEYDPTNQLKKVYYEAQNVWTTNPANAVNTQEYSYTADRLNRASVSNNGVVTSYVMPNGMNQYTTVGGQGVSYDARFNIAGYNGMTFTYDAQNRLVGGSMQATYDGLGRCVKRTVNGQTRLFTYDEWNPILEWDQSGNRLAWNVYGARPDEILARDDTTHGSLVYKQDHHGNVVTLLSWSGVVEKYTYDAFGKATVTDAAGNVRGGSWYGNRFMFTGREWIAELGIYDYRNRMYHPALGRFLQVDPLGLQTERAKLSAGQKALFSPGFAPPEAFANSEMNLFRFCGDDPVDGSDPTGLLDFEFGKDAALKKDFETARNYLSVDKGMRDGFAAVENSSLRAIVVRTDGRNHTDLVQVVNKKTGEVVEQKLVFTWNPRLGAFFPSSKNTQSPAMGLGHEVAGHGERYTRDPQGARKDPREEMRVIIDVEAPAARNPKINEGVRFIYEGRPIEAKDVLDKNGK
jgi:RHS repeat-associated protein